MPSLHTKTSKKGGFPVRLKNSYAPLEAVSSDTTGPLSEAFICGNKYLQLIADAAIGWTTGEPMA